MRDANGRAKYAIGGRPVRCSHCGNESFAKGSALLNTVGMTLVGLDWADKKASILMCAECGHIEWFVQEPTAL